MFSRTRKTPDPTKALTPAQAARQAEAEVILARHAAEIRAMVEEEKLATEVREANAARVRSKLAQTAKENRSKVWSTTIQTWTARFVPFLPLVLVNTLAIFGQLGWGRENLTQVGENADSPVRWVIAALFAATLESIALFLAYYANRALNRGDSASALYLGAFGVAAVVAGVNYSHYADQVKTVALFGLVDVPAPTAMGIVFALCSLASPWLWRIKHRDANRGMLHELGIIDTKAVRLSMARKIFYPIRSYQVTRMAVWDNVVDPAQAVKNWETRRDLRQAEAAERKAQQAKDKTPKPPKDTTTTPRNDQETPSQDVAGVEESHAPVEVPAPRDEPHIHPPVVVELPEIATKWPGAWNALDSSTSAGNPISQRKLATLYTNKNRHQAIAVITEYKTWKGLNHGVNSSSPATA